MKKRNFGKFYLLISIILFINNIFPQTSFFGLSSEADLKGAGTIFRTNSNGDNLTTVYKFEYDVPGSRPELTQLCLATNGKLYGVTKYGGINDYGVLFEFDANTNTYLKRVYFDGSNLGKNPVAGLLSASNGKLYGTTTSGGSNGDGTLFEYNVSTNTITKLIDFSATLNGSNPSGKLFQAQNGKLYGTTISGAGSGGIYEFDFNTNVLVKKKSFAPVCSDVNGGLIEAGSGKLYGLSRISGMSNDGVVFYYDINLDSLVKITDLSFALGSNSWGQFMKASNGMLYAVTQNKGANNAGTLLELNPTTNTLTVKYNFNTANGSLPTGFLIESGNGKLYGLTNLGGANNNGVLFEYDFNLELYTKKADFLSSTVGSEPGGALFEFNGKLFGLSKTGGKCNSGTLFCYDKMNDTLIKQKDLNTSINGRLPNGGLVYNNNGKLYGMTRFGGIHERGVIFEFDPQTNLYSKKADFDYYNSGAGPFGSLVQASNGKFYGLTYNGGSSFMGTLFEYDNNTNTLIGKVGFNGTNGKTPGGSLILAPNGKLYGLTIFGGTYDNGVIFEYDPVSNTLTVKHNFDVTNGSLPHGSLFLASDGKMYGLTKGGGPVATGIIFKYDYINNVFTNIRPLQHPTYDCGSTPIANFIEESNGILYGTASAGGGVTGANGTIFKYDFLNDTIINEFQFVVTANNGRIPESTLMRAINGKLYGLAKIGGNNGLGVLFEFNPITQQFTKKFDFDNINGANPRFGPLIEIATPYLGINKNIMDTDLVISPNPNNNSFIINFKKNASGTILINDITGKTVFKTEIENLSSVNLNTNLEPGVYFLQFMQAESNIFTRIVIQ